MLPRFPSGWRCFPGLQFELIEVQENHWSEFWIHVPCPHLELSAAFAAGIEPQLIRLMGRWSSDVYEIYCRLSAQSALRVGMAISSATVSPLDPRFEEEQLELLAPERDALAAAFDMRRDADVEDPA